MAAYSFVFIDLIDPLHNGAGEGLGIIDRPIVREKATNFPFIQSSSFKGVLRSYYSDHSSESQKVIATFGPKPGDGNSHGGASAFGEGQLLAFPIRSLKGCFVWATSRLILHRLQEKVTIAGILAAKREKLDLFMEKLKTNTTQKPIIPEGSEGELLSGYTNAGSLAGASLLLEEFDYRCEASPSLKEMAEELGAHIFPDADYLREEFAKKLVVLPDDAFTYFVSHSTEVLPNIAIGDDGTTKDGFLRYTEYLPRDSVIFSLVTHEPSNIVAGWNDAGKVKEFFDAQIPQRIQVGGDETTGKGLVSLTLINPIAEEE